MLKLRYRPVSAGPVVALFGPAGWKLLPYEAVHLLVEGLLRTTELEIHLFSTLTEYRHQPGEIIADGANPALSWPRCSFESRSCLHRRLSRGNSGRSASSWPWRRPASSLGPTRHVDPERAFQPWLCVSGGRWRTTAT